MLRMAVFWLLPVLSGVLLYLAFPRPDMGWLAWIGLVPLLVAVAGRKPKQSFLSCFFCGIFFFAGVFSWVFEIPGYRLLHHAVLIPYMALYFGLFGLAFGFVANRRSAAHSFFIAPFLWVSLEYLRANLGFLSLPWALLGHTQHQYPVLIQFASFTGAYGVSFLLVLANASLAAAILAFSRRTKGDESLLSCRLSLKQAGWMLAGALGAVSVVFIHGTLVLKQTDHRPQIKVSVLQGNIDRHMKANPRKHATFIMEKYSDLTRQAAADQPELIVWPEAATPGFVLKRMDLLKQVVSLVKEVGTHFLIGSSEYPKFIKDSSLKPQDIGNTALFFSPEGKVRGQYLKIHLVPFGEYLPLENLISWPGFLVPEEKRSFEVPGQEYTLFDMGEGQFGVLICWEIVFPDLFREFVKSGANFMLNITNEGWFGPTAAPYQLAGISVFRAVENRVSLTRSANTGVSCFIDPYGRVTGRVQNKGQDIFVAGYLTGEVTLTREKTFYTRHGDVFVYFVLAVTVFTVGWCCSRRRK